MLKITEIQNSGFPSNFIPLQIILDFTYFDLKVMMLIVKFKLGQSMKQTIPMNTKLN